MPKVFGQTPGIDCTLAEYKAFVMTMGQTISPNFKDDLTLKQWVKEWKGYRQELRKAEVTERYNQRMTTGPVKKARKQGE